MVVRSVEAVVEVLPPVDPRYPGNARRRLRLSCGHVVERSHLTRSRARCEACEREEAA